MNKKLNSNIKVLLEREALDIKTQIDKFYPNGILADDFMYSSQKRVQARIIEAAKTVEKEGLGGENYPSQEQLAEKCRDIKEKVCRGELGFYEIKLDSNTICGEKKQYLLGNTMLMFRLWEFDLIPYYLFIKAEDAVDIRIYLDGNEGKAYLVAKDTEDDYIVKLWEFHMISLCPDKNPLKEIAIMISYLWLTATVDFSVIMGMSLAPIKKLLLSEYIISEWKRVKDDKMADKKDIIREVIIDAS